jgi:hypothetical protein
MSHNTVKVISGEYINITNAVLYNVGISFITLQERCCDKVRFQILTAASMKMAIFWVAAQCTVAEVYQPNFYQSAHSSPRRQSLSCCGKF